MCQFLQDSWCRRVRSFIAMYVVFFVAPHSSSKTQHKYFLHRTTPPLRYAGALTNNTYLLHDRTKRIHEACDTCYYCKKFIRVHSSCVATKKNMHLLQYYTRTTDKHSKKCITLQSSQQIHLISNHFYCIRTRYMCAVQDPLIEEPSGACCDCQISCTIVHYSSAGDACT